MVTDKENRGGPLKNIFNFLSLVGDTTTSDQGET